MNLRITLLCGLVAAVLPIAGFAQIEATTAPAPHLLVGLGAIIGSYQLPFGLSTTVVSPVPMVGVQLRPRSALQVSAGYYQEETLHGAVPIDGTNGRPSHQSIIITERRHTIPSLILVRHSLTRHIKRRLQIDLLAGSTILSSTLRKRGTIIDSTQAVVSTYVSTTTTSGIYLALGPSLRYSLNPHLDLTSDWVFNKLLNTKSITPNRLSASILVGIKYRF